MLLVRHTLLAVHVELLLDDPGCMILVSHPLLKPIRLHLYPSVQSLIHPQGLNPSPFKACK